MKRYLTIAVIFLFASAVQASAQNVAVKTNALYWMTATPNVGLELAMADRWTFDLSGGYNPWTLDAETNSKAKHFLVSPEVRYWFCESFNGHFLGLNANYTMFNIGGGYLNDLMNERIEGWAAGAGLTYGHAWMIGRRWNLELTLGLGLWYTEYETFESRKCGMFQDSVEKLAFAPTALGLSFIYLIR